MFKIRLIHSNLGGRISPQPQAKDCGNIYLIGPKRKGNLE
jgi:hypothetical protein